VIELRYEELVFQKIVGRDNFRTCYSHSSYSTLVTLECGHERRYSKYQVPKHEALCHVCTLIRATDAKNKPVLRRVK